MATPSRAIKLVGTEQPDVAGKILRAGPVSIELDNGNVRYVRLDGVEVLRAIAYLVRDENWGTYTPTVTDLMIDQRADSFSVTYHAVCGRGAMQIAYDARIDGKPDGSIEFRAAANALSDFLTSRTGFVVLHPLQDVAGRALQVEYVDGAKITDHLPAEINPICPFTNIRALSHEVLHGVWATCRMEGDAFEMEDHRNWTDASFKTYVRPLAKPWPYTIAKDEVFDQSVTLSFSGALSKSAAKPAVQNIVVKLGSITNRKMPPVGLGLPAEELGGALEQIDLLELAAPKFLVCHFDPRKQTGAGDFARYKEVCESVGAEAVLEIVVESIDDYVDEFNRVAQYAAEARLKLSAVAVCPVGDLKSVLPGGARPPAPPLDALYIAARKVFPLAQLGGGMFSFFTELNRKRPPARLLDFVTHTSCPIVHAADDRSVMETLEALPYQVQSARSFTSKAAHRVGPSAIGCRDNPHGATYFSNPNNQRVCLAKIDPRQRALFGAAWTLGYLATFARAGVAALSIGAPTGPLGIVYRKGDHRQPWFDELDQAAVYPLFHVIAGLTKATGAALVVAQSSAPQKVLSFAHRSAGGTRLWLANLTASDQTAQLIGLPKARAMIRVLDENNFVAACTGGPAAERVTPLTGSSVALSAYAVACVDC